MIKIEYEKTMDTIEDMLQSEIPIMMSSDTLLPYLLETDPRTKIMALSEKIEFYVYGAGEANDRIDKG